MTSLLSFFSAKVIELSSKFQRFSTVTQEISKKAIYLAIAMVLNTAFIYVLIKAEFNEFRLVEQISKINEQLRSMQEKNLKTFYMDFSREWYQDIGLKIIQTMTINIIIPIIIYLTMDSISQCCSKWSASREKYQYKMNEAIKDKEIELSQPYAISLNSLFITLIFAPALPILVPICCLTLLVQYWVNKMRLFRRSSKPPQYDGDINSNILGYLKIAFFIHILFAMYIYSNQNIFPNSEESLRRNIQNNIDETQTQEFYGFRIFEENSVLERVNYQPELLAYLIICIVLILFGGQIMTALKYLLSRRQKDVKITPQPLPTTQNKLYSQLQPSLSNLMLATYDIQKNPNYTDLIKAIDTGIYLQHFLDSQK